jgi:hypothetical protein
MDHTHPSLILHDLGAKRPRLGIELAIVLAFVLPALFLIATGWMESRGDGSLRERKVDQRVELERRTEAPFLAWNLGAS